MQSLYAFTNITNKFGMAIYNVNDITCEVNLRVHYNNLLVNNWCRVYLLLMCVST